METRAGIFSLQLTHTFGISRWSHDIQKTFVVSLSQDGKTGYGEATENAYYHVTTEDLKARWEDLKPFLENHNFSHPENLWKEIQKLSGNHRFLMAAIDEAAWDLYGKLNKIKTFQYWKLDLKNLPLSTYTIGLDKIETMQKKILEKPWPVYKIKLGTEHDEEIVRALREVTDSPFRVDANAAWDYEKAKRLIPVLKSLGVEVIEQPLPPEADKDTRRLKEISPLPLIADESCKTEADLPGAFENFHGINVKLTKAGGLTPGKKMLDWARKSGAKRMVGCMTESTIGISAAAQLLPLVHYADLDGALLIDNDLATGATITSYGAEFPEIFGNGVRLKVKL